MSYDVVGSPSSYALLIFAITVLYQVSDRLQRQCFTIPWSASVGSSHCHPREDTSHIPKICTLQSWLLRECLV